MNIDQFWILIEASRRVVDPERADGNARRQAEELWKQLSRLPPEEIVEFSAHFQDRMDAAFQWDLWGVAYIVAGGCSDDGFADFRSWLISMGRRVFEDAVANAESLIRVVDAPGVEDVFFEEFRYVPARAYEAMTGCELPPALTAGPAAPTGEKWREEELAHRFPSVWARNEK
ncbi:DUF4240 domain-containing protein [Melittangium boletus]|uniref:DUF4240 domain-containing protein n=1 Tax=Melittangium boletus DSM 14713 TaxID=1294270 RepID=A0A250IRQ2_9BACT|nr:DUF4240 domain-containing protein [Melittangium boletus]ATB33831.1 hypothetical protein MEBOL_007329 [Melittangium boletus DSM 14713]